MYNGVVQSVDTSNTFEGLRKRAMRKIIILSVLLSLSIILIIVGIAGRSSIGDLQAIVVTQFGAILLGLSVSQIFFSFLTLPDIVDKTIFVTHGLDNPIKATGHISDKRDDQRIALECIVRKLCGKNALPPDDLVKSIVGFVDRHSHYGFLRGNYRLKIELVAITERDPMTAVRDRFYEAKYTASYDVINVCGERKPYRVKLMLDNHDYDGIPHDQSISLISFGSTKTRIENGTTAAPKDYLQQIRARCPDKLRPLVGSEATVFINLIKDADPAKTALLDELLTESIDPGEKLTVQSNYRLYLRKQDLHEISMMYFTKGVLITLIAPKRVHASFIERYEGAPSNAEPSTSGDLTTWVWGTQDFVYPHEGGTVYWHTSRP
jgi:hypothetical protein